MWRASRVMAGVLLFAMACNRQQRRPALHDLVVAAPLSSRSIEPRLSGGFRWAPYTASSVMGNSAILSAANSIISDSASSPSDTAVAQLLAGNIDSAIEHLEGATPKTARVWSDLAAARCMMATRRDKPAEFPRALAAADRALVLDSELPEAHFNRAIVLEKMGLRSYAAVEWAAYLARDSETRWADEARIRLRKDRQQPRPFRVDLKIALAAANRGDSASIDSLARRSPQDARGFGEGVILLSWRAGDAKALQDARFLADAIVHASGDYYLLDYVEAIHDGRASLSAFDEYVKGREAYSQRKAMLAERHFGVAATLAAHTPLEKLARYFAASAAFDQDRVDESDSLLRHLLSEIDRQRYPGLTAEIEWQLGRCDAYRGRWSSCLSHLATARSLFDRLHEPQHVAFIDAIVAEAYDHMGMVEEGWRYRIASCDVLSRGGAVGTERLHAVVTGGVRAELYRRQYEAALSLATMLVNRLRSINEPEFLTEALIRRAYILHQAGRDTQAALSVAEARQKAQAIRDEATARRLLTESDVVDALICRKTNPEAAVRLLSSALQHYTSANEPIWIVPLFLERGRTYSLLRDDTRALSDFLAAIAQTEEQRENVRADDLRSDFFDAEPELFAETADLLIRENRVPDAFNILQRASARTLIEQLELPPPAPATSGGIQRTLHSGDLLIAYQLLPGGLAIFTADSNSLRVQRVEVSQERLRTLVAQLRQSMLNGQSIGDVQRHSLALRRVLIKPIADQVSAATRLVIVPDRFLWEVPFSALYDDRYLVETHAIAVIPTPSLLLRANAKRRLGSVLVVGDPEASLPSSRLEAMRIANLYRDAILLLGAEASVQAFVKDVADVPLIHYAGHAREGHRIASTIPLNCPDGICNVTAVDVSHLMMNQPTVILAACGTLRAETDHIEGAPSLARAFLSAGARTVVGTLWDIPDDASAPFFLAFHENFRSRPSAADALAITQREFISRRDARSRPGFWAAVEVLGLP